MVNIQCMINLVSGVHPWLRFVLSNSSCIDLRVQRVGNAKIRPAKTTASIIPKHVKYRYLSNHKLVCPDSYTVWILLSILVGRACRG